MKVQSTGLLARRVAFLHGKVPRCASLLLLLLQLLLYCREGCDGFLVRPPPPAVARDVGRRRGTGSWRLGNTRTDDDDDHDATAHASFVAQVRSSLADGTFVSVSLSGPPKPKKKRTAGGHDNGEHAKLQQQQQQQQLRGCVRSVSGRRVHLKKKDYLQATIKFHGATDVAKNWRLDDRGDEVARGLDDLLSGRFLQTLSESAGNVDYFHETSHNDNNNNDKGIRSGELATSRGTWTLAKQKKKKKKKSLACTFVQAKAPVAVAAAVQHDRAKNVPLAPDADFFQKLGVTHPDGKPRPGMASKLRQCQRFVEIVGNIVTTSGLLHAATTTNNNNNNDAPLTMVDMGCGRGYLTFALHSYLQQQHAVVVESCGIDMRPKLVREINGIAKSLGDDFKSLRFVQGAIEDFLEEDEDEDNARTTTTINNDLDVLIALHACDTATDDALWFGLRRRARVIVTAPCCHREVRRQLDDHVKSSLRGETAQQHHPLHDVLRHGIYRERVAESVTDSLRALLLEAAGYDVQVFEFVGGEHTSKNVMITAVRRSQERGEEETQDLRRRIVALASSHGVTQQTLARWMGESVVVVEEGESSSSRSGNEDGVVRHPGDDDNKKIPEMLPIPTSRRRR